MTPGFTRGINRSSLLIFAIAFLDAVGIGIVFPTLPGLLRSLLDGKGDIAEHYGFLLAAYAATMLLSSPLLGALSDRYGRRPLLLCSLFGTALDDLVMALAPTLSILYLGRTLAGFTGANYTVANAYLTDITTEENRSAAFGRMSACFGVGIIAGPVLGGLAGTYSLRAPFYLAAALNGLSALICLFILPESRRSARQGLERVPMRWTQLNPLASLRSIGSLHGVSRLLYVICTVEMVGQVPAVLWVVYGTAHFGWTPAVVGVSLALFGLIHALVQAFLPALVEKRVKREGTVLIGMASDSLGYVLFSFARSTAAAFSFMPLLCVGGLAQPALQAMLTSKAGEDQQGELQGVITSLNSLIAIVGPIAMASLYAVLQRAWPEYPGSVWMFAALLYFPCFVLLLRGGGKWS